MIKDDLLNVINEIYGKSDETVRFFQAPGRVNLIGEHIDYNGGYVFPAAIDKVSTVAIRKRNDSIIKLYATDLRYVVEADMKNLEQYKNLKWGNYQLGVIDQILKKGLKIKGAEFIFDDKVPLGSGLSSSAAIEVVTAYAILQLYGYKMEKMDIALLCQKAEHEYVGVKCGIMDQFASVMGKKDHAMLLDCNTLQYEYVPVKMDEYSIVISNTNKKRSLGSSMYNKRRSECEQALSDMQKKFPDKKYLCDFSYKEFLSCVDEIIDEDCKKRAEHAVCENLRVLDSVKALRKNDIFSFCKYLNLSHISLRDLYEVSCKELDVLVENAWMQKDVLGSRMTGAGFGGCTVSIVKSESVETFIEDISRVYSEVVGYDASFYVCNISDGVKEI
ncbi:MAG TPA: galactokinase [Clostridia bacterium]|jgi:galactokinase|nr:MAG: Galactokinase [Firmicutes bacterium ADurb.Bin146]HOD92464.1 galactokinase [Clostridia bacterium]HQM38821.1 galactokinase [Clostridia bacterium]